MHQPYEKRLGHPPDFRVEYRFYDEIEGGRKVLPRQGYRSDFWYHKEEQGTPYSVQMIWPEFEDKDGKVVTDADVNIRHTGTARMWIVSPAMRKVHREKIKVGLKGFFMEGLRRVADCEVIEIVGLHSNPTKE